QVGVAYTVISVFKPGVSLRASGIPIHATATTPSARVAPNARIADRKDFTFVSPLMIGGFPARFPAGRRYFMGGRSGRSPPRPVDTGTERGRSGEFPPLPPPIRREPRACRRKDWRGTG